MSDSASLFRQNLRDQRWAVGALVLSLMTASLMARTERALFLEGSSTPRVLAVIPVPAFDQSQFGAAQFGPGANQGGLPRAFFLRRPHLPFAPGLGNPFAPVDPAESASPIGSQPVQLTDAASPLGAPLSLANFPSPIDGFTPGLFPNFDAPNNDPVNPVAQTLLPLAGVLPGVPEPSVWLTLLIGFAAVGTVLRRRASLKLGVSAV